MSDGVMLTVDRVIAAPPSVVWKLMSDLDAWPKWGPAIRGAELDQPYDQLTTDATGVVHTSMRVALPFRITEFDPGRYWAWQVAGIPATGHRLDPAANGARVTIGVPWWSAPYLAVCAIALQRMEGLAVGPA